MTRKHTFNDIMLCVLFNMFTEIKYLIPAVLLFILHFITGMSLLFSLLAFLIWIIYVLIRTAIIAFANKYNEVEIVHHDNKNPYSAKTEDILGK